ncbi:MAG: hypothetical protein QOH41_1354, partial [Blastocatellia bacterium]|nr:hypothetical protein [Blastocatellia bacterium]
MRLTHRLPARLIRWTSLSVCFALILASLTLITPISSGSGFLPQDRSGQSGNDKAKKVNPSAPPPGPPAAQVPSLDEVRQRQHETPKAARHIESTMRSRRKPLESRHGRRVGDPLPPRKTGTNLTTESSERVNVAGADKHGRVGTVQMHHARSARSLNFLPAPMPQGGNQQNVTWTNIVGVTVSGNSVTKTAATAWGNAGAASTQSIVSGDGYVEFSVTSLYTGMVALSHTDPNQDYTSMQFALLPNSDGNLYVFESGMNRGVVSTYTTADVFRVAVEGGVVKYRKNGTLVYTSTVAPTYPLLVDAGLYHNG